MRAVGHEPAVAYISSAADLGASTEYEAGFQRELEEAGVPCHELGHATRRNPVLGALRLRRLVRATATEVLHVHLPRALPMRLLACRRASASTSR